MRKNLRSKAYEYIKNKILLFHLKPGNKIIEKDIASSLKISRTPVREAILMLENEGLVVFDKSLGYIIRKPSVKEVEEYLSLRETLELFAAPKIIEKITKSDLLLLEKNVNKAEDCLKNENFDAIVKCEGDFHRVIYMATKSAIFFDTISALIEKFQWVRAVSLMSSGGINESLNGHKAIIEAIRKGNQNELEKQIRLHVESAKKHAKEQSWLFFEG